jgi:hypothetical protein
MEETLRNLGFNLIDRGTYWQCNAIFRNGDNKTAIKIYKNSGVWCDYVVDASRYYPFARLMDLCGHKNNQPLAEYQTVEKMEVSEFFSHDEVKTLVPHYSFYNKRGIKDEILKMYRSGFAMSEKMNGRFVFPIFDENERIIGLSGRHLLWKEGSVAPKWKHIGRKANWIFPIFNKINGEFFHKNSVEQKKEIVLVESIGDSLALTQNDILNHLVVFGLDISPKQIMYLVSESLNKIIIASNNDKDKEVNRGLIGAIKIYLKLCSFFDVVKLEIRLPSKKDFGEMLVERESFSHWVDRKIDKVKQVQYILNFVEKSSEISPQLKKNTKYLTAFLENV